MMQPTRSPETVDDVGACEVAEFVPIYTIGYGARDIDGFVDLLQQHEIAFLIDVRSAPYSRYKPEFSKAALEEVLARAGIRYVFMGDLLGGQPKDPACHSDGKVDYEKVREMPFYRSGIRRLQDAYAQRQRVVLLCSEGKPEMCHRSKLIGESLQALDIPLAHIDENGEVKDQDEVISRLTGGQLSLFGEHGFTSRKRYQADEDTRE